MQTCISMQKTSSFHLFILQIKSVIESRHQIRHTHFGTYPPKRSQSLFDLHEFVPACKKSVSFYFILFIFIFIFITYIQMFILEIQSILESRDQIGQTHFSPCPVKKNLINFYFLQICISMQNEAVSSICSGEIVDLKIEESDLLRVFWLIFEE